jgi:hypothetical protein
MQQQFPFDDGGGPMPKRMRQMEGMQGPMDGGPQMQQQQNQQQQRGPGWAGVSQANDYCQNFVDTGLRPQNYLGGKGLLGSRVEVCHTGLSAVVDLGLLKFARWADTGLQNFVNMGLQPQHYLGGGLLRSRGGFVSAGLKPM